MSIQVTGTLKDPIGNPLQTSIRITAESSKIAVEGSYAVIIVGGAGTYDFNLEEGVFLVQLLQQKEYTQGTLVEVANGTPSPITLSTLLADHKVVT